MGSPATPQPHLCVNPGMCVTANRHKRLPWLHSKAARRTRIVCSRPLVCSWNERLLAVPVQNRKVHPAVMFLALDAQHTQCNIWPLRRLVELSVTEQKFKFHDALHIPLGSQGTGTLATLFEEFLPTGYDPDNSQRGTATPSLTVPFFWYQLITRYGVLPYCKDLFPRRQRGCRFPGDTNLNLSVWLGGATGEQTFGDNYQEPLSREDLRELRKKCILAAKGGLFHFKTQEHQARSKATGQYPCICIGWIQPRNSAGDLRVKRIDGTAVRHKNKRTPVFLPVHQLMCLIRFGSKPSDNVEVSHRCGVKTCINPYHLGWETKQQNAGRHQHAMQLRRRRRR